MRRPAMGCLAFVLAACSGSGGSAQSSASTGPITYREDGCDDTAFAAVRASRADGSIVTVCGHIADVDGDRRTRRGLHKHWRLSVHDDGAPIEIDSNEDLEGEIALARGDYAVVRGVYYADPGGRDGVHDTHRDPRGRREAGFVVVEGRVYQ